MHDRRDGGTGGRGRAGGVAGHGKQRGTVAAWHRPYVGPIPRPLAATELNGVRWPAWGQCLTALALGALMAALIASGRATAIVAPAQAQLCDLPLCDPMPRLLVETWLPWVMP